MGLASDVAFPTHHLIPVDDPLELVTGKAILIEMRWR